MYKIDIYYDAKGRSSVENCITVLELKNDKHSKRCKAKIMSYIEELSVFGVNRGMPVVKHLRGRIWELRPLDKRILFFKDKDAYVLLHIFEKETNKTPRKEIVQAKYEMEDYLERKEHE